MCIRDSLQRDVAAGAAEHVDIALHMLGVNFAIVDDGVLSILFGGRRRVCGCHQCGGVSRARSRFEGRAVFRIHGCGAAPSGRKRHFLAIRELGEERIIARQVIRHGSARTRHFNDGLAGIGLSLIHI